MLMRLKLLDVILIEGVVDELRHGFLYDDSFRVVIRHLTAYFCGQLLDVT